MTSCCDYSSRGRTLVDTAADGATYSRSKRPCLFCLLAVACPTSFQPEVRVLAQSIIIVLLYYAQSIIILVLLTAPIIQVALASLTNVCFLLLLLLLLLCPRYQELPTEV
jgi:hypothetical protein